MAQKTDHRVVTQSGAVTLRLGANVPGVLTVEMFTECGSLRRGRDVEKSLNAWFEESNFQAAEGDTVLRSWPSWTRRPGPQGERPRHNWEEALKRHRRVAEALHDRSRPPGIEVISRASTLTDAVPEPGPAPGK